MTEFVNKGTTKLNYLKENYSQLARQGSQAWLLGRRTRFGGSEIGELIDKNTEKGDLLIFNKVHQVFESNIYCWWGNTFEVVAKKWFEWTRKIKIHEFGAIPSTNYPIAYSPDGVFIDRNDLWLLEIKCPFIRNVTAVTKIKPNYMTQVQVGMQILPCNYTRFMQFKFRRCKAKDLFRPGKYDRFFHQEKFWAKETPELWFGALYWRNNDGIRYDIITDREPDKIFCSFEDPDLFDKCEKFNHGVLMYFKCFYICENVIPKDRFFEAHHQDTIWKRYNELMEYHNQITKDEIHEACVEAVEGEPGAATNH